MKKLLIFAALAISTLCGKQSIPVEFIVHENYLIVHALGFNIEGCSSAEAKKVLFDLQYAAHWQFSPPIMQEITETNSYDLLFEKVKTLPAYQTFYHETLAYRDTCQKKWES